MNKFFSKIVFVLVVFSTLFLQGCASTGSTHRSSASASDGFLSNFLSNPNPFCSGSEGCTPKKAAGVFWDEYSKEYKILRSRGGRISAEGKVLTPVPGKPGQFQDDSTGFRMMHKISCNKENVVAGFFGDLITAGGTQLPNVIARVGAVGVSGAVRSTTTRSRFYKCEELAEELNGGNVLFRERFNNQVAAEAAEAAEAAGQEYAQSQPVKEAPARQLAQSAPTATLASTLQQTSKEFCDAKWQACPAGGEWGTKNNDTQCGCR